DYRAHCDRLLFATTLDVPRAIFPADAGLIVADAYGAALVCEAPEHRLHGATRKCMMLAFARAAAHRLQALADPDGPYQADWGRRAARGRAARTRAGSGVRCCRGVPALGAGYRLTPARGRAAAASPAGRRGRPARRR